MDYIKILVLLLCFCLKAPLEPHQLLQTRQILEELVVILPELPTSPGPLYQELSRRGIMPQYDKWTEDLQNIFNIGEALIQSNARVIQFIYKKLEMREDSLKREDFIKLKSHIKSDRGLGEIFNQIINHLDAPLLREYNRINGTPKTRKDLIVYGLKAKQRLEVRITPLKELISKCRPSLHRAVKKDIELQTLLRDLKWTVERQALFIYDPDNPIDGQLEVAQEHLQNGSIDKIAFRALVMMSQATMELEGDLYPVLCCYNRIFIEKKQINLEEYAEFGHICQKFVELSKCLGELCDSIKVETERQGQSAVEG